MLGCLERRTLHKSSLSEPRMQLVVMAAVLAMTRAGQDCRFTCLPTLTTITVKSCVRTESINTTMCEGQCFQKDPVSPGDRPQQMTCSGDWAYEVKHFEGCLDGVTYPVARSCKCSLCQSSHTDCERVLRDGPMCYPPP